MFAPLAQTSLPADAVFILILAILFVLFVLWLAVRRSAHTHDPVEAAPPAPAAKAPPTQAAPAQPDDLKKIEGIGPKISGVLNAAGVTTFAALAAKSAAEIQALLDAAGVARISDPATWPEQAALAADGKDDELAALQDALKGGRRA